MHAEDIQREMLRVRANLRADMQNFAQRARETTDWRHYVGRYPWLSLAAVAAAGYLVVPQKRPSAAAPAQSAATGGHQTKSLAVSLAGIASSIAPLLIRTFAGAVVRRGMDLLNRHNDQAANGAVLPEPQGAGRDSRHDHVNPSTGAEPW